MNKILEFKQEDNVVNLKFEIPPCRRTLIFSKKVAKKSNYFLSFPTISFSIEMELYQGEQYKYIEFNVECSFIINKKHYLIPLPNFESNYICLGIDEHNRKELKYRQTIFENQDKDKLMDFICNKFWLNKYDSGLNYNVDFYKDENKKIVDLDYWEQKTKQDPNWIPSPEDLILIK